MNTQISADFRFDCGERPILAGRSAGGLNPFRLLLLWQRRERERRALSSLDDRLLQDMGLDRRLVRREAAKPFWKA